MWLMTTEARVIGDQLVLIDDGVPRTIQKLVSWCLIDAHDGIHIVGDIMGRDPVTNVERNTGNISTKFLIKTYFIDEKVLVLTKNGNLFHLDGASASYFEYIEGLILADAVAREYGQGGIRP